MVVPTAFPNVKLKDLADHKIHEVENELSSMEDIFKLQKTYSIKEKEEEIEKELKRLGYIT